MSSSRVVLALLGPLALACGLARPGGAQPNRSFRAPAPRGGHALTFDETNKVTLLFGGAGEVFFRDLFRDLWSWDGRRWTRLANTGPGPREDALLAHDSARGRTVMFGGRGFEGRLLTDTWEWDGALWRRMSLAGPEGRIHASGAFDPVVGRLRVYGGFAEDGHVLDDTWEWDGSSWTRVAELGASPGLAANGMAFDRARRRTLLSVFDLQAQNPDGTFDAGLWEWSGDRWQVLEVTGPRYRPVQDMTARAAGGVLLLDPGDPQAGSSTWTWDRHAWALAASLGPTPRFGHGLATDFARERVVLFGGFQGTVALDDTWEWNGSKWTQVAAGSL